MDIGLKIKNLRKERGITQEQLAQYLNISSQAVSKWENGTAMPDISLIPSIVAVFEISADVLLGIEIAGTSEREKAYEEEYIALCKNGDIWGRCALMRKALAEFPRNYGFMSGLARSLFYCIKKDEDFSEVIALCNRIINTCRDTELVCSARETLVRAYAKHGDKENAMKYALSLPHKSYSAEYALEWALDGEKQYEIIQGNAFDNMMDMTARIMGRTGPKGGGLSTDMGKDLTPEQAISIYQTVLDIFKVIFPDENYLVVNGRIAECHRLIARVYATENDKENAMKHLYLAEKHGDKFDEEIGKNLPYTSVFFDRLTFHGNGIIRHVDSSEASRTLRKLQRWDCFNFMRDSKEFKEFERRIQEKADRLKE